jgi:flagellar biosynthesis/type III secretory pathway chaperone
MNNNLKDVILQTLEELDQNEEIKEETVISHSSTENEFLLNLREKLLVLFEGLQSPNIVKLEQKLDLTINFLEFVLAEIEKKLNE